MFFNTLFSSGRFSGQGVIVTGGAGGIGGMIVHRLLLYQVIFKKRRLIYHGWLVPPALTFLRNVRFLSDGAKVAIIDLDPEVTP